MQFVNHYSALILWVLLLAGGISVVVRRGKKPQQWAILGGLLLATSIAWLSLRPVETSAEASAAKQPSVVEIQSPFCLACLAQKAEVDRAEREFQGKVAFRRVNIQSSEGRKLAEQYGVERTPSFIFLDEAGEEQWQSIGKLDLPRLQKSISSPH